MTIDAENDSEAFAVLGQMIDAVSVFMLTTRRTDGSLRSLPAVRVRAAFDGTVLLFADPESPTLAQLPTCPDVSLTFADVPQCRYVSLSGVAEAVADPQLAEHLWNPDYREWLPQGLQEPTRGLFRVTVQHAEYWDAAHSAMRQIGGLMKGLFTGNRPAVGNHESLDFSEKSAEP